MTNEKRVRSPHSYLHFLSVHKRVHLFSLFSHLFLARPLIISCVFSLLLSFESRLIITNRALSAQTRTKKEQHISRRSRNSPNSPFSGQILAHFSRRHALFWHERCARKRLPYPCVKTVKTSQNNASWRPSFFVCLLYRNRGGGSNEQSPGSLVSKCSL